METGTHPPEPFRSGTTQPGATDEAKEKAKELTRTARDRAISTLDRQKEQLSGLIERVADSVQDDRLGAYASDYARRGAEFLRRHSADEILDSMRHGIRTRPGLALSACFVAGLAIARLVKGSMRDGGRFDMSGRRGAERGNGGGESGYRESAAWASRDEPWREDEP